MSSPSFIFTQAQYEVLAKVFRQADVDETGIVDCTVVPSLASKIFGQAFGDRELDIVRQKTEQRGGASLSYADFMELMSEVMIQTTRWGTLQTKLDGYVGFDTVQEQIKRKLLRRGFEFNIIVVGESGLGKSTLINTLFRSKISRTSCTPGPHAIPTTTEVDSVCHVIEEQNVRLKLTVTDTPGFGDQINNENCWVPVLDYINDQFEQYLNEEVSVERKKYIPDTRVHCCVYFIAPTGHHLKPLDVEFMKRLHNYVNIVPVIAKADTLTLEERDAFKQRIREDIAYHGINIYPAAYDAEDEEEVQINKKYDGLIPFAVLGSDQSHTVNGKQVLGRQTKWGLVEVENKKHCDFSYLRDMLIRSNLQDLKETTDKVHYENFRRSRLQSSGYVGESNI